MIIVYLHSFTLTFLHTYISFQRKEQREESKVQYYLKEKKKQCNIKSSHLNQSLQLTQRFQQVSANVITS